MRWVRDRSRRFERRPFYDQHELDDQCEELVAGFLNGKNGSVEYPISTDDLTVMIERDVAALDLYSNLAREGRNVEGVSEFRHKQKPSVRIARYLSESPARENRLRSTLAHEYGHVVFHGFLWALDIGGRKPGTRRTQYRRCRRSRVIASPQSDWMEWQAGYAGGAILMPVTPVRDLVATAFAEWDAGPRVELESDHHADLIGRVAAMFAVSRDAAAFRLQKLGYTRTPTDL